MTTKLIVGAALAAIVALGSTAFARDKASQKFLKDAMEGNLAEVQIGQLAQKNGNSEGVRSFGQMLVKDHSDANKKATEVAKKLGVTPPTEPNAKQKSLHDRLSKLTGARFDQEFVKEMVADHKNDIREFEAEAKKTDPAGTFAKDTLPTLRKHLQTAESLAPAPTTGRRY